MGRVKKIRYKKNVHQKDFHNDIETKFLHMSSGFGGGKTYALVMKMFQLSMVNKDISGGLVCPSYTDFKKDVYPLIDEICYENKIKTNWHGSDHTYQFPWSRGKLYVVSAEKKIRGPNWGFAGINEATLIPHERYKEVIGRVRVKKAKCPQVASVGTPEGIGNWAYEAFYEHPLHNSRVVYGDTRDNIDNLDPDYIRSLEDSYDSIMLDAYLKGLWVNMKGNRFYYAYDPNKNDNWAIKRVPGMHTHVSLDFNVSKMVATCWHYDGVKLRGFDQIVLKDNADTNKMCDAMKARGYMPDNTTVYPDPAGNSRSTRGESDVVILRNNKYHDVRFRKAAPRMRRRQLNTNGLLDKGIVEIHPESCNDLKKDFESVVQDPVRLDKDKSDMERTHASDGFDYMCDLLFPFKGPRSKSEQVVIR